MSNTISRRAFLTSAAGAAMAVGAPAKPQPNIIFIMSDDHAAHAISAYGSKINRTPNQWERPHEPSY